jgi:hypothetical protein
VDARGTRDGLARGIWLRSLGWDEAPDGMWTGPVLTTRGGRYRPMPLDQAFDVAVKRSVIDGRFRVEIGDGRVRIALPWREVSLEDLGALDEAA